MPLSKKQTRKLILKFDNIDMMQRKKKSLIASPKKSVLLVMFIKFIEVFMHILSDNRWELCIEMWLKF